MSVLDPDADAPILFDFPVRPGVQQVSFDPAQMAERSAVAVQSAMSTIHQMARRVIATMQAVGEPPAEVAVEFGIKVDAAAGALIARTSGEASLQVKLTWRR
jgi:hypothetical protein